LSGAFGGVVCDDCVEADESVFELVASGELVCGTGSSGELAPGGTGSALGVWATTAMEPAVNRARTETRMYFRIIQDQPLNSDWMPRLTLESNHILAVIAVAARKMIWISSFRL
jgi:hypothetical protein